MSFREYIDHDWKLCAIQARTKGPRTRGWNKLENAVTLDRVQHLEGAGLLHAYSGTCAIDIDNMALAKVWFRERGIDIDALLAADDAVQITRGDKTRGKLIYLLRTPLASKKIIVDDITILEFRCADSGGGSVQDVLPPSIHPSGEPYAWKYNNDMSDWRTPPMIPAQLLALWESTVVREKPALPSSAVQTSTPASLQWVRDLLATKDPDCSYDEWRELGMRLHEGTDGDETGFALWNEWSAGGTKYPGESDLAAKWDTFGRGTGPQATLDGLRREIKASDADFGAPLSDDVLAAAEAMADAKRNAAIDAVQWNKLGVLKNRPPTSWLVRDMLPAAPLSMMYGPSGAGKSLVAFDIEICIVLGVPWRDKKTVQGAVGWLTAEAEGSMRNRSRAYEKGHDNIVVDDLDFYVLGEGIDLTSRERVRVIAESARKLKLVLIVVDTLAAASGSANENSGEDMNPVLDNCKLLHDITGASVLLIHHSGKDEAKGSRGWSGIKARLQAEIEVKKRPLTDLRDIAVTKQRDGDEKIIGAFRVGVAAIDMDAEGEIMKGAFVEHVVEAEARVAVKPIQGKWEPYIRNALAAAKNQAMDRDSLLTAALRLVPDDMLTDNTRSTLGKRLTQLCERGELREPPIAGDGLYRFVEPYGVAGNPDADEPEPTDPDADVI